MKERTVVMTFEIITDLPVKELRTAHVNTLKWNIRPVNKPRVEVIQPVKRKKDR